MPYEVMQVSSLPPNMLKDLQEQDFVLHDHSHILDPAALARVRALIGNGATAKVDKKLLMMMPNVKMISIFGETYDGLDLDAVLQKDILVTHTPSALVDDVADLVMALMLNLGRRVLQADRFVRNNDWVDQPFALTPKFSGSRLGLLGFGQLGRAVAKRAAAFDMPIAYCDLRQDPNVPYRFCRTATELAQAVDHLVVALPGGDAVKNVVNAEVLQALGAKGCFINASHAEVVDPAVLIKALQDKVIAGAALDAFWEEPRVPAELRAMSNVVLTPRIASATVEGRSGMAQLAIDNLKAFFQNKAPLTPIPECVLR